VSSPAHGNGWRFRLWNGKHWLRWPLRILLGTYVAFVLLVNLAINSKLPWGFLRPSDNSSCITWSWGWSFLPAFATVHNFYLTVEDDNIQMGIRIDRAQVRYSPTAFLHQTFHATAVNASGVSFRFRVKKTAEEIAAQSPETRASLPSIPGFQDPPLRKPRRPLSRVTGASTGRSRSRACAPTRTRSGSKELAILAPRTLTEHSRCDL
jgi:hypothetical protein